jgi:hypothetical protein
MWRTASWIGADGLIALYRQHHTGQHNVRHIFTKIADGTPTATRVA